MKKLSNFISIILLSSLLSCSPKLQPVPVFIYDTTVVKQDTIITKTDSFTVYYDKFNTITHIDTVYKEGKAETKIVYDTKTLYIKTTCYGDTIYVHDTIQEIRVQPIITNETKKGNVIYSWIIGTSLGLLLLSLILYLTSRYNKYK